MDDPIDGIDGAHEAAWHRIETALARLDAAAQRGQAGRRDETALATQLREEQARHAALRSALRDTLGRIDTLIASHAEAKDSAA